MKSWKCIENYGACCKFNLPEREDYSEILTVNDIALINSMTRNDAWCKYLDKYKNKCLIYGSRPYSYRVNEFSTSFKGYLKNGDKFIIDIFTKHISSIHGSKSKQMKDFKKSVKRK